MKKTAISIFTVFGVVFALGTQGQAQTQPASADTLNTVKTAPDGSDPYPGFAPPPFKMNAEPRTMKTGAEVAVFGGIDFSQFGDFKETASGGVGATAARSSWWPATRNHIGTVLGLKLGYTWPGWGEGPGFSRNAPAEVDEDWKPRLLPSIEYEFLYVDHTYEGKGPMFMTGTGTRAVDETDMTANMKQYIFTVNPVLRAQIWRLRPYFGMGVGGAVVQMSNAHVALAFPETGSLSNVTNTPKDRTDVCLAAQVELGTDIFITKSLSIFGEYKLVGLVDPEVKGPGGYDMKSSFYGENIGTAGIRYHF